MPESIFDIDLIEEGDHIFSLILGVVNFFNAVEDNTQDNLMGHDASIIQKISITLLNTLYCRLQHVLWLTVHTYANGQLDPTFGCASEKRKKPVTCRVLGCIRVFIEVSYLFLVDGDRKHLFLFKFVRMVLVTFDDHESIVFVQLDLRWHQENLRKEILLL